MLGGALFTFARSMKLAWVVGIAGETPHGARRGGEGHAAAYAVETVAADALVQVCYRDHRDLTALGEFGQRFEHIRSHFGVSVCVHFRHVGRDWIDHDESGVGPRIEGAFKLRKIAREIETTARDLAGQVHFAHALRD
jgi:hypothetical protein